MHLRTHGLAPLLTLSCALCASSCDPFHTGFEPTEDAVLLEARQKSRARARPETLVVMNWNAKFGAGRIDIFFDCHGDRVLLSEQEVKGNLDGLIEKINQVNPDILLLQEIDLSSKRAAYVDQVRYLLEGTRLNYAAYASQWRADFIPTDGIGPVDSGNAILSRHPIEQATRIALPLVQEQSALTRYFYLKRNILKVRLRLSEPSDPDPQTLWVLNVHTDAYGKDGTKQRQIDLFKRELDALTAQGQRFVAGGDLNTIPPGSQQVNGFDDSVCQDEEFQADDYSQEGEYLSDLYNTYPSAIPLADYQADNRPYFTHTTLSQAKNPRAFWNRTLDYLFTNARFVPGSGLVHQDTARGGMETMPLSDHAPLTVVLDLRPQERP